MKKYPVEIERKETYGHNTTGTVEWRVWNPDHTMYARFTKRKDAIAYAETYTAYAETYLPK